MLIYQQLENITCSDEMFKILNRRVNQIRQNIESEEDEWLQKCELKHCEDLMMKLAQIKQEEILRGMKKIIRTEVELGLCGDKTLQLIHNLQSKHNEALEFKKKKLWFWLTINPDWNKITIEKFKKNITKLVKKKSISDFYIVIEQRCDIGIEKYNRDRRNRKKHNEMMLKSIHAHILLKRDITYKGRDFQKFAGDCKNTFKNSITSIYKQDYKINSYSEPVFFYHWLSPDMLHNKMNYIKGFKQIEEKNIKQELDPVMRKMINVPDFIDINNILLL